MSSIQNICFSRSSNRPLFVIFQSLRAALVSEQVCFSILLTRCHPFETFVFHAPLTYLYFSCSNRWELTWCLNKFCFSILFVLLFCIFEFQFCDNKSLIEVTSGGRLKFDFRTILDPRGVTKSTLGAPFSAQKAPKVESPVRGGAPWTRPGLDLAPKTAQNDPKRPKNRFWQIFHGFWTDF